MKPSRRRLPSADQIFTLIGAIGPLAATGLAVLLACNGLAAWRDLALLLVMYLVTGLGVTLGFHRMLAHRSFQARSGVRFALLALGCMAGHTDPVRWASTHLQHHASADRADDPHSPRDGFFHAHFGWIYDGVDAHPESYGRWLLGDPMVSFFRRTFYAWAVLGLLVPFAIDGWRGLLWGGLVRLCLSHHITFCVNSVCHVFGRRPFATGDRSTNHWVIGLLALGEGWHNNHHAFPQSAFHGLRWWQIDLAGYVIVVLEKLRLISNVRRVSPAAQAARLAQAG